MKFTAVSLLIFMLVVTTGCDQQQSRVISDPPVQIKEPEPTQEPVQEPLLMAKDFDECVALGNPVMKSLPRQCQTVDGRTFVEILGQGQTCTDTDAGNKYGQKGTLTFCSDGDCIIQDDECLDDNALREYYCANNALRSTAFNCETGCIAGACNQPKPEPIELDPNHPTVLESRKILLSYGFSEQYFDDHFSLVDFKDELTGYVSWEFSIGDYKARISDSLGYYTSKGERVIIHSIAPPVNEKLPLVDDITAVIPKSEADNLMQTCLPDAITIGAVLNIRSLASMPSGLYYIGTTEFECPPCVNDPQYACEAPCISRQGIIDLQTGDVLNCDAK